MVFELYSIKDTLAEEYGPIFTAKNRAIADRNYNNTLIKSELNPEEYVLKKVGAFDNVEGTIVPV